MDEKTKYMLTILNGQQKLLGEIDLILFALSNETDQLIKYLESKKDEPN